MRYIALIQEQWKALCDRMIQITFVPRFPLVLVRVFRKSKRLADPRDGRKILADLKWGLVIAKNTKAHVLNASQMEAIVAYLSRCNVRI